MREATVFVGNIQFDITEEQLRDIFSSVGEVVEVRLSFDSKTGKPRGFAFVEFKDVSTAESAVRNLNGHELKGRDIRVSLANNSGNKKMKMAQTEVVAVTADDEGEIFQDVGVKQVNEVLKSLERPQIHDIVAQVKNMVVKYPDQARHLMMNNPQFVFALLQAQVMLGMVNPAQVQQIVTFAQNEHRARDLQIQEDERRKALLVQQQQQQALAPQQMLPPQQIPLQQPPQQTLPGIRLTTLSFDEISNIINLVAHARRMHPDEFAKMDDHQKRYIQDVLTDVNEVLHLPQQQIDHFPRHVYDIFMRIRNSCR